MKLRLSLSGTGFTETYLTFTYYSEPVPDQIFPARQNTPPPPPSLYPFYTYKGMPPLPSNITRDCPLSLLLLQGIPPLSLLTFTRDFPLSLSKRTVCAPCLLQASGGWLGGTNIFISGRGYLATPITLCRFQIPSLGGGKARHPPPNPCRAMW